MELQTKVDFNGDGEPSSANVHHFGHDIAHFKFEDRAAILTNVQQCEGEDVVYASDIQEVMDAVERLPFVEKATFPDRGLTQEADT